MKSILILAAGIWIGQKVFVALAEKQSKEKEDGLKKRLEEFLKEKFPELSSPELKEQIASLIKVPLK